MKFYHETKNITAIKLFFDSLPITFSHHICIVKRNSNGCYDVLNEMCTNEGSIVDLYAFTLVAKRTLRMCE